MDYTSYLQKQKAVKTELAALPSLKDSNDVQKEKHQSLLKQLHNNREQYINEHKPCSVNDVITFKTKTRLIKEAKVVTIGFIYGGEISVTAYQLKNKTMYLSSPITILQKHN